MVDAAPFAALRYDPAVAGDPASTSAPAYDDLERFTYARHRAASPYTVLELLSGEDDGTDAGYSAAGAAFRRWVRTGVLVTDPVPAYYLYEIHELRSGVPHVLRGVLAAVDVRDDNLIPHEAVDPVRVAARARRMDAVPADLAPVFAVHTAAPPAMRAVLDGPRPGPPIVAFTDEAGADHRVWRISGGTAVEAIRRGLAEVQAVIADGHHRFAAAARRRATHPEATAALAYLVDGSVHGPQLRPVHRLVRPVPADLADLLGADFTLGPASSDELPGLLQRQEVPSFGLCRRGQEAVLLTARDADQLRDRLPAGHSAAWARLDAAVWEHVVRPLVGSATVTYASELTAELDEDAALFVLRPASLRDVVTCALRGERMPAKSTWFRPKPRAGLVMRSLESIR